MNVSNRIAVVPMDAVESYLKHEIISEGKWRSGVPLVVVRPDAGLADDEWLPDIVSHMQEVRRRYGSRSVRLPTGADGVIDLDIGLIDITVSIQHADGGAFVRPRTSGDSDRLLKENLRHVETLCGGALHDQMVIAIAPHIHRSDGSLLYHHHNLIFGLRHEARGNMDVFGTIDLEPLMQRLGSSGPLSIIGGIGH